MDQFGKNLRARSRALGLSDAEVARRAGISARRMSFYVTGDRAPDLRTLVRLARVLDISVDDLVRDMEDLGASPNEAPLRSRLSSAAEGLHEGEIEFLLDVAETMIRRRTEKNKPNQAVQK
jgi:transcriptional regulator with XRE-family HTH domain